VATAAILDYPSLGLTEEGRRALAELDKWRVCNEAEEREWEEAGPAD
jgi:hypothetical protein